MKRLLTRRQKRAVFTAALWLIVAAFLAFDAVAHLRDGNNGRAMMLAVGAAMFAGVGLLECMFVHAINQVRRGSTDRTTELVSRWAREDPEMPFPHTDDTK